MTLLFERAKVVKNQELQSISTIQTFSISLATPHYTHQSPQNIPSEVTPLSHPSPTFTFTRRHSSMAKLCFRPSPFAFHFHTKRRSRLHNIPFVFSTHLLRMFYAFSLHFLRISTGRIRRIPVKHPQKSRRISVGKPTRYRLRHISQRFDSHVFQRKYKALFRDRQVYGNNIFHVFADIRQRRHSALHIDGCMACCVSAVILCFL